jgi:hypothetical protein
MYKMGARLRRSGGDSGGGCARRPANTYPHLHAVGDGDRIAVLGLARWRARRDENWQL